MEFTDNRLKENFKKALCSTKLFPNEMESIANLALVEKWSSPMVTNLLSGKLIVRGSKLLLPRKF